MREIKLRGRVQKNLVAFVDDEDFDRINSYRWYRLIVKGSRTIYARTVVDRKTIYMHHMVLPAGDNLETDHKDRNGLNNQLHNLRRVTHAVNQSNASAYVPRDYDHIHKVTARGRVFYYHRKTRTRLPDDPNSPEFAEALARLNGERGLYNTGKHQNISSIKSTEIDP